MLLTGAIERDNSKSLIANALDEYRKRRFPESTESEKKITAATVKAGLKRELNSTYSNLQGTNIVNIVFFNQEYFTIQLERLRQGKPNRISKGGRDSSIIEIIDKDKGTFKIKDWSNYPDDYVPMPDQNKVWTFLDGEAYDNARDAADTFNRNMRSSDSYYSANGLEIHEIEPVKMG